MKKRTYYPDLTPSIQPNRKYHIGTKTGNEKCYIQVYIRCGFRHSPSMLAMATLSTFSRRFFGSVDSGSSHGVYLQRVPFPSSLQRRLARLEWSSQPLLVRLTTQPQATKLEHGEFSCRPPGWCLTKSPPRSTEENRPSACCQQGQDGRL